MRNKAGFWVIALALLSFLTLFGPHQAYAQPVTSNCDSNGAKSTLDAQAAANRSAFANQKYATGTGIMAQFPIIPAVNECVQKLTDLIANLPSMANPFNLGQALINGLIQSVVGQVCSSLMATITSVQNAITGLAHVCLPLPPLSGFGLPTLPQPSGCSGGLQVNLLTSFSSTAQPPTYNYKQYMK